MFLNKKTLFAAFTAVTITGCATTVNTDQQKMITNLESSLSKSTVLTQQTQSELALTKTELAADKEKISTLNQALARSKKEIKELKATTKALKMNQPEAQPTIANVKQVADKTTLGQAEWVYVSKVKENFKGRIDTGAATSSINAVDIERFERDGEKWVRFSLTHAEGEKAEMIEAKVERLVRIIQSSNPDEKTERLVIKLHVRIGDVSQLTEFTLTNRLHMEYPVLIGRSFIRDVALVDIGKEYIFPKYQAPVETKK